MNEIDLSNLVVSTPDGIAVRVKVVPGANRTNIGGVLGDRLKIAVGAPPEGGKANKAVCALFAELFGVAKREVAITRGPTQPFKTVEVMGVSLCKATEVISGWIA